MRRTFEALDDLVQGAEDVLEDRCLLAFANDEHIARSVENLATIVCFVVEDRTVGVRLADFPTAHRLAGAVYKAYTEA
jgi:hypothetical protein